MNEDEPSRADRPASAAEAAAVAGGDDADVVVEEDVPDPADRPWYPLFPYEPYPQQTDAIDRLLDVLADNGWLAMEGACGTGKTLIALVAGLYAVREESATLPDREEPRALPSYDRILAVTPVKQQLAQFVEEVRAINRHGDAPPANGLVLRGLGDTLAYAQADGFDLDAAWTRVAGRRAASLTDRVPDDAVGDTAPPLGEQVDSLREHTADLVGAGSPVTLRWDGPVPATCSVEDCTHYTRPNTAEHRCPHHQDADDDADAPWYDAVRARRVVELVEESVAEGGEQPLAVHGVETPYPDRLVRVLDVAAPSQELLALDWTDPVDPFYARALVDPVPVSFADGPAHVLDRDDLVPAAAAAGHCPHRAMGDLIEDAEVVVGNYYHLYDPETRNLTGGRGGALDEETVAIVDEAHVVEERVRDVLSRSLSVYTLARSLEDVERARRVLRGEGLGSATGEAAERAKRTAREIAREVGRAHDDDALTVDEFGTAERFHEWLLDWIGKRTRTHLTDEYARWQAAIGDGRPDSDSVPLAPPGEAETDDLTAAIERGEAPVDGREGVERLAAACRAAASIHEAVAVSSRTPVAGEVGAFLESWVEADPVGYFRELVVEHSPHDHPPAALPDWADRLTAELSLYNCIPTDPIADVYADLGGGVAMSATLEPVDVYAEAAGLATLERGVPTDPLTEPGEGRRVESVRYGLAFPEDNRATWGIPLDRFTHRNRGEPTTDYGAMTPVRQGYAHAIRQVASEGGNVLLCLPNYREAEWAAALLEDLPTPVYLDRSSTSETTTAMLDDFFDEDGATLVTSALGTVTEGVDYDGEKLHTACVVGVPYRNTQTPRMRAVQGAYDAKLAGPDGSGFEMAVAVPAVRKARQAIGRAIRGPDERGVRLFVDERYLGRGEYEVGQYLSGQEWAELRRVDVEMLDVGFERFWSAGEGDA